MSALAELSPEIRQFGKPAQEQAEISVKYEGYLERQETLIRHARQMEETLLPEDLPYEEVSAVACGGEPDSGSVARGCGGADGVLGEA